METDTRTEDAPKRPIGYMVLAVFAPFITIALLATPLAYDALKGAFNV